MKGINYQALQCEVSSFFWNFLLRYPQPAAHLEFFTGRGGGGGEDLKAHIMFFFGCKIF